MLCPPSTHLTSPHVMAPPPPPLASYSTSFYHVSSAWSISYVVHWNGWLIIYDEINRCLRRCAVGWSGWPERFYPTWVAASSSDRCQLLRRRRSSVYPIWLHRCTYVRFLTFILSECWCLIVCILAMQRLDVAHHALYLLHATFGVNKSVLYQEKNFPHNNCIMEPSHG